MLLLLIAHFAAALVAPVLVRWLGRRAFLVLALVPAWAAAWAVSRTAAVMDGRGPTRSVEWLPSLGLNLTYRLDTLSWLLVLMVGGIGAAVLVYCSRYFSVRSTGLGRFAATLTAFAGAMFGLVTSANLIQVFVFWELTTVFSYLLIGHYSDRASSRRAAMKAILVTTTGGLAMLVGILIIGSLAGTFDIPGILANPPTGTGASIAIALILVGALSKSALFPFHFWLPAAMAAPTPVSAYLHAAAMVKAGVYLVARFAPGFSTLPVWQVMVLGLGLGTLLIGGWLALRQNDLKLILAYGTVSQLGLLVVLVGSSYEALALAGLALLGAHAMFKASLFLVVGVVDAATGTRDLRRLSGLGKKMPVTAIVGGLATASMIALFPFAGFVAKEAALDEYLSIVGAPGVGWFVVGGFILGSVLTVAYGIRLWWGAFGTKRSVDIPYPIFVTAPPLLLIAPPAVLAVGGLLASLMAPAGERLLSTYSSTYPLGGPGHLVVWPGFTPAFGVTLVAFALGFGLFLINDRVQSVAFPWPRSWDADRIYRHTLRRIDSVAADVTARFQRGSLPFYLGVIFLMVVALPGGAIILTGSLPDSLSLEGGLTRLPIVVLVVVATVLAARSRRRLKAVMLAGITGYGTAMIFLLNGAPDLALTQVLVETVTLVVFVLVLRRLPVYFSDRPLTDSRWVRLAIGGAVGLVVASMALIAPQARIHEPVSAAYPEDVVEYGGGYNIVNIILVDVRAWDTMGEISVLLVAATGVASLLFLSRRTGDPLDDIDQAALIGASDYDPLASLRAQGGGRARSSVWLAAGVTLAPQRRSVILEVATRILFHTMVVFGVFLLFSGHNEPGGGFVAGLVTGIALAVRYLAGGRYELSAAAPLQPHSLLGTGLFLATGTGIAAMLLGGDVLQSAIIRESIPVFGDVKLVTSIFFDIGVYLVVVGLMLDILRSLGAEIDRQGEESGHDSDQVGPALEPTRPVGGPSV